MKKVFILLLLVCPILLFSQKITTNIYTISGKIIDSETKSPIEDATIIFKDQDSVKIKCGAITNSHGNFSIDVKEGNYNATVEFLSYKSKKLNITTVTKSLNIGTIELEVDTEFLNEIEVVSEKKALELKSNKMVFNVERDLSAAGSTATQLLNNIPSVNVDADGEITLRGLSDVTVMINGRTSSMTKAEALKSLPAGSIEKIEVLANPGAKYRATSTGIINIILKKGKDEGLNASVTASGGYKDYYGGLLTLNHKSKYINFFTNTSYYTSNPITTAESETEYFENGITSAFLNENSEFNKKNKGFLSTIGADFYLTKKTTLTTTFNYFDSNNTNLGNTETEFLNASKEQTATNIRKYESDFTDEIFEFIVNLEHKFNKEGRVLTSYFSYKKDNEQSDNTVLNTNTSFTDETYTQKNILKNYILSVDYVNPIGESFLYHIGYQGEFGKIPFYYTGTSTHNDLKYSENIHSAYVDLEYELEKFYFTAGLRAEFQESDIEYFDLNTSQHYNQNDLFPSASIDYTINDTNSIGISYGTAIQRIIATILQPYEEKISETSSYIGNENIQPVDIYMASLYYSYTGEKLSFSPSLFYNRYIDYWEYVTYETGEQINGVSKLITSPFNVGNLNYYGLNVAASYKVSNNLNFNGNVTLTNFDRTGTFETINSANETITKNFDNENLIGSFSLLTQVKIPTIFDFQINVKHDLASNAQYFTRRARTYANAAISKDIFNKEATVSLTVDDIFNSNQTDRDRFDTGYFSNSLIKNKYRTIILSFTYRFNQSKKDRRIDFDKKEEKPNY
ncbi:outer membrane beta-barrel protein [Lutibacter sp.]|uniref:outer membrane beta-barrel protein n=1 Tax=Lutibacter sp. TaxID=1925666 RepID=UPI0035642135